MARTYHPTLIWLVKKLCKYSTEHADVIRANMTGTTLAEFDNLRNACTAFLNAYGEEPINP